MSKLKLDLDTLEVESFRTETAEEGERGTVHGHIFILASPYCGYSYNCWMVTSIQRTCPAV